MRQCVKLYLTFRKTYFLVLFYFAIYLMHLTYTITYLSWPKSESSIEIKVSNFAIQSRSGNEQNKIFKERCLNNFVTTAYKIRNFVPFTIHITLLYFFFYFFFFFLFFLFLSLLLYFLLISLWSQSDIFVSFQIWHRTKSLFIWSVSDVQLLFQPL